MGEVEGPAKTTHDLNVSFGYRYLDAINRDSCECVDSEECSESSNHSGISLSSKNRTWSGSFSGLSGAAISANFTLANTNIGHGFIGEGILPELDSPNSFKKMTSSTSYPRLDLQALSPRSSGSPDGSMFEIGKNIWRSLSEPTAQQSSNFLNVLNVQMAGGAAGEDRVQAVCSEKNGLLICGIYDGFNGRDAADFLAGTLCDNIAFYLYLLECHVKHNYESSRNKPNDSFDKNGRSELTLAMMRSEKEAAEEFPLEVMESYQSGISDCLLQAVQEAETEFLRMVEEEMEDRPDLVSIGSCILIVLLKGTNLYILNLGDSRAVLATRDAVRTDVLQAMQLTEIHTVDNESEYEKVLADHPDDPAVVTGGKLKGKLKVTRAIGVGYLKKKKFNEALMGILRVRNLVSPPYVHSTPHLLCQRVTEDDLFVVLGSDGLFDFFTNEEVVQLVYQYSQDNPLGDPAKYLVEKVLHKAAKAAGMTAEELMDIPVGRRRKYHDDVTVIVIFLGSCGQRTTTASTSN